MKLYLKALSPSALKHGSVVEGKVIELTNYIVIIKTLDNLTYTIPKADVIKVKP